MHKGKGERDKCRPGKSQAKEGQHITAAKKGRRKEKKNKRLQKKKVQVGWHGFVLRLTEWAKQDKPIRNQRQRLRSRTGRESYCVWRGTKRGGPEAKGTGGGCECEMDV